MKRIFTVLVQTLLLFFAALAGFAAGAVAPSLRLTHVLSQSATNVRTYDFDWLAAVLLGYALLLLWGLLRKRFRPTAVNASAALALTLAIVVLFTKIGFKDTPL